jgi:histidinol phosphatase-like enzyme
MKKSFIIGDRMKDMIAGKKTGLKTILFNKKKINKTIIDTFGDIDINYRINSLKEIYKLIK